MSLAVRSLSWVTRNIPSLPGRWRIVDGLGRNEASFAALGPKIVRFAGDFRVRINPIDENGRWIYVPCDDGQYWVIDGKKRTVAKKIRTGGRPHNTQCSRDGARMYLSPMGNPKQVTIVDVKAGHKVIGQIPFDNVTRPPALAKDEKRFFQHIDGLIGFQVADIADRKVTHTIRHKIAKELQQKASRCHGLAIRPDQKEIWSCNVEHHTVHIHDITSDGYPEIAQIPMIERSYWLCFSPDSKYAYISVRGARKVAVVDCKTKKILKHLEVGDNPKRNLVITLPDKRAAK